MSPKYHILFDAIDHIDELKITDQYDLKIIDELEMAVGDNEDLQELLQEMLNACLNYTRTVANMSYEALLCKDGIKSDEYRRISEGRGRVHNHTISQIKIFCRWMNKLDRECNLTEEFGENRAAYGRYALKITFSRLRRF